MSAADILKREIAKAKREALGLAMTQQLRAFPACEGFMHELAFHPTRKWRFDFAWPAKKVALEVEGGTYTGKSRHTTGTGFAADIEKYNIAAINGWRVIRADSKQVKSGEALRWVVMALAGVA